MPKIPRDISGRDLTKLLEDDWFINYVNKRGVQAKADRKKGKQFVSLKELQQAFK